MEEKDAGLLAAVNGALSARAPSDPSATKSVVATMPGLSQNNALFDLVRNTLTESALHINPYDAGEHEQPPEGYEHDTSEAPEASPVHKITDETTDHVNPALAALRSRWAR